LDDFFVETYMGKITQNRTFFAVFEDRVRVVKVRYNIST